jgi:hypothetical protein
MVMLTKVTTEINRKMFIMLLTRFILKNKFFRMKYKLRI